jgi:hypothetical protein
LLLLLLPPPPPPLLLLALLRLTYLSSSVRSPAAHTSAQRSLVTNMNGRSWMTCCRRQCMAITAMAAAHNATTDVLLLQEEAS